MTYIEVEVEAGDVNMYCPYTHTKEEDAYLYKCTSPQEFPCYGGSRASRIDLQEVLAYLIDAIDGKHEV